MAEAGEPESQGVMDNPFINPESSRDHFPDLDAALGEEGASEGQEAVDLDLSIDTLAHIQAAKLQNLPHRHFAGDSPSRDGATGQAPEDSRLLELDRQRADKFWDASDPRTAARLAALVTPEKARDLPGVVLGRRESAGGGGEGLAWWAATQAAAAAAAATAASPAPSFASPATRRPPLFPVDGGAQAQRLPRSSLGASVRDHQPPPELSYSTSSNERPYFSEEDDGLETSVADLFTQWHQDAVKPQPSPSFFSGPLVGEVSSAALSTPSRKTPAVTPPRRPPTHSQPRSGIGRPPMPRTSPAPGAPFTAPRHHAHSPGFSALSPVPHSDTPLKMQQPFASPERQPRAPLPRPATQATPPRIHQSPGFSPIPPQQTPGFAASPLRTPAATPPRRWRDTSGMFSPPSLNVSRSLKSLSLLESLSDHGSSVASMSAFLQHSPLPPSTPSDAMAAAAAAVITSEHRVPESGGFLDHPLPQPFTPTLAHSREKSSRRMDSDSPSDMAKSMGGSRLFDPEDKEEVEAEAATAEEGEEEETAQEQQGHEPLTPGMPPPTPPATPPPPQTHLGQHETVARGEAAASPVAASPVAASPVAASPVAASPAAASPAAASPAATSPAASASPPQRTAGSATLAGSEWSSRSTSRSPQAVGSTTMQSPGPAAAETFPSGSSFSSTWRPRSSRYRSLDDSYLHISSTAADLVLQQNPARLHGPPVYMPMGVSPALRQASKLWHKRYQGLPRQTLSTASSSAAFTSRTSTVLLGPSPSHHVPPFNGVPLTGTSRWSSVLSGQPPAFPKPRFVYLTP